MSGILLWFISNLSRLLLQLLGTVLSLRMRRISSKWRSTVVCVLSRNSQGLFFPIQHRAQILLRQIWSPQKCQPRGKNIWEWWRSYWRSNEVPANKNSDWYKKPIDATVSPSCKIIGFDGDYIEKW